MNELGEADGCVIFPVSEGAVTIHLTEAEADALYFWTQSDDCPNYWESPLDPVGRALALWYREGASVPWSNR